MNSSKEIFPLLTCSLYFQTNVPEPTGCPWKRPFSIGPPVIIKVGRSTLAAPINNPGGVLSQFPSKTTPSNGWDLINSSTSIANMFRYKLVVGLCSDSLSDIAGNSSGKPPASQTPRFTASATSFKEPLHGFSSDQVFAIPITGRPSKTSGA